MNSQGGVSGKIMGSYFDAVGLSRMAEPEFAGNFIEETLRTHDFFTQIEKRGRFGIFTRSFGEDIEVWLVSHITGAEEQDLVSLYPGYRGRFFQNFQITETFFNPEEGKGIMLGNLEGREHRFDVPVCFFLPEFLVKCLWYADEFQEVSLVGLGYGARIWLPDLPADLPFFFFCLEQGRCDYFVSGRILEFEKMDSPFGEEALFWFHIDLLITTLEVVINEKSLEGTPEPGAFLEGNFWLQGFLKENYRDVYEHIRKTRNSNSASKDRNLKRG